MTPHPPTSTLFPYTTLFRSVGNGEHVVGCIPCPRHHRIAGLDAGGNGMGVTVGVIDSVAWIVPQDRKSTRLNSSHVEISYAVFCLKKKTQAPATQLRTEATG